MIKRIFQRISKLQCPNYTAILRSQGDEKMDRFQSLGLEESLLLFDLLEPTQKFKVEKDE